VNDNGTLTPIYTIFTDTGAHPGATPETVGIATSTDGTHFTPSRWKMVIGSGHNGHGRAQLYSSTDLRPGSTRACWPKATAAPAE
jgi:hypothetical protein